MEIGKCFVNCGLYILELDRPLINELILGRKINEAMQKIVSFLFKFCSMEKMDGSWLIRLIGKKKRVIGGSEHCLIIGRLLILIQATNILLVLSHFSGSPRRYLFALVSNIFFFHSF